MGVVWEVGGRGGKNLIGNLTWALVTMLLINVLQTVFLIY